jgi:hypothetical protein
MTTQDKQRIASNFRQALGRVRLVRELLLAASFDDVSHELRQAIQNAEGELEAAEELWRQSNNPQ